MAKQSRISSEDSLIQVFRSRYSASSPLIKKGIGDDAAVIRPAKAAEDWVITSDMLVEEIDFRREWTTPRQLGRKSLAVNLSDLAAMGAKPMFFTVALAVTPDISKRWILDFHDGLTEKGLAHGARLVGGDLSGSKKSIVISVTAIGESIDRKIVYRSGGKPGDLIYVTGSLGRSAAGLKLLQQNEKLGRYRKMALEAHRNPEPRCAAGLWLAQSGCVHCMMDLSDGISVDLPRLCAASRVGAEIWVQNIPLFQESALWGFDPAELALHGGEDYELLFAVPASRVSFLEKNYPSALPALTCIGKLTSNTGKVWLSGPSNRKKLLVRHGWDHFNSQTEHK